MLPLPNNQPCSNILQPPSNDVDDNLGANMSDQDHSPLIRQCLALLTKISAAVNRNIRLMDSMANYIMLGCPGATGVTAPSSTIYRSEDIMCGCPGATGETVPSSTIQELEGENNENMFVVKTRRFRACTKPPKHKDPNELHLQVSCISINKPHCLNIATGQSS
jgi:hypothetical protein